VRERVAFTGDTLFIGSHPIIWQGADPQLEHGLHALIDVCRRGCHAHTGVCRSACARCCIT
jgi:hypothetical protein